MPVSLDEMMAEMPAEARAEIEAGSVAIVMQNRTLRDLRESLGMTQGEFAAALETSQANVSKLESRTDVKVSTIARAVAALGGSLQMVVNLPGRPPATLDVGTPDSETPRRRPMRSAPRKRSAA
jgi:DNA-binding transcriptional regulator YiaG